MRLRVDGDVLVYRAGFACEHTRWTASDAGTVKVFDSKAEMLAWADTEQRAAGSYVVGLERDVEPVTNAYYNVRSMIDAMSARLATTDVLVYLSGPTNFRTGLATLKPYKGNRDPAHKPVHAADIKAMMRREYDVITSQDEEADDAIAQDHYAAWRQDPYSSVIATIDKDLDMIPGLHYNFAKDLNYYVTPEEGLWKFYLQCLTGDTTDNIPGIDGVGPVKAARLLPEPLDEALMYDVVAGAYERQYGDKWEAALLEVGRLLWIRREPSQMWAPPTKESE